MQTYTEIWDMLIIKNIISSIDEMFYDHGFFLFPSILEGTFWLCLYIFIYLFCLGNRCAYRYVCMVCIHIIIITNKI